MPIQITRRGRYRLSRDGQPISEHNAEPEAYENALEHAEDFGVGDGAIYRIDPPYTELSVPVTTISRIPRAPQDPTPDVPRLAAPGSPSAVTQSSSVIRVSWSAVVGAVSYNVYLSEETGGPFNFYSSVQALTHDVTGLTDEEDYFFKVTAVGAQPDTETLLASCTEVSDTTDAGAGGGEPSSTYTATHLVAPFADVSGAVNDFADLGAAAYTASAVAGSAIPTTLGTAMARAVAGNKVKVAPGLYAGDGGVMTSGASVFAPTNSGSIGNPIVFYAEYPAAYNSTSPTLLSELRRAINGSSGRVLSTHPSGVSLRNYIIFDGFYINEFLTRAAANSGAVNFSGQSSFCEIRRFWFDRTNVPPYGAGYNGSVLYSVTASDIRVTDCLWTGNSTLTTQQDACFEVYNTENLTIENCEFRNAGISVHLKAQHPSNLGLLKNSHVRYCKMFTRGGVVTQSTQSSFIYHNLMVLTQATTGDGGGVKWTSLAANTESAFPGFTTQVQVYNNTILRTGAVGPGPFSTQRRLAVAAGTEIYNNIFQDTSGNNTNTIDMPADAVGDFTLGTPNDFDRMDYNFYVDSTPRFHIWNGTAFDTHTTFAAYQTAMAARYDLDAYSSELEAHSQIGTATFVDTASENYRLASNGQAALTASLTAGPVGCYVTGSEEIGLRADPTY